MSYFRLDGKSTCLNREKMVNKFNSSSKVLLFLMSTKVGSLGMNLVGDNRVVIFDASWNASHGAEAACRV